MDLIFLCYVVEYSTVKVAYAVKADRLLILQYNTSLVFVYSFEITVYRFVPASAFSFVGDEIGYLNIRMLVCSVVQKSELTVKENCAFLAFTVLLVGESGGFFDHTVIARECGKGSELRRSVVC